MKVKKKVIALLLMLFLGLGYLVAVRGISYKVLGYRNYSRTLDAAHLTALTAPTTTCSLADTDELRHFALTRTAGALSFRLQANSQTNPNKILDGQQGHCKMYAYVLASCYNQLAQQQRWKTDCRVAYGHVYWYGINLHRFSGSSFFRDHDFNVIRDAQGVHAVDATLYDYLGIKAIEICS